MSARRVGTTTIAGLDAGNLLQLALVGEQSAASIDPANGTPSATDTLSPLTVSSVSLPALDAASLPSVQTTSTGDPDQKTTTAVDLSTLPQPVPVLTGAINPATLTSLVDVNGAQSSLTSTVANVGALAGVIKIDSASANLGGIAGPTSSVATRAVSVDGITVLDLRGLLNLLGLDLNRLPLSTLTALLGSLGQIPALNALVGSTFTDPASVLAGVSSAQTAIDNAQTQLQSAVATLTTATNTLTTDQAALTLCLLGNPLLCSLLQDAVNTAQGAVNAAQGAVNTAQATLTQVIAALHNLLAGIGNVLDLAPLLRIEGVQVGAVATATDAIATSSATVTGAIGHIKLGGIDLGGVDVNSTLAQVQALAGQATSQLDALLAGISPSLANLVSISLFQQATDVSQSGAYVNSVAGITGLIATVTPPDICALLSDVLSKVPVGGSLPGVQLPATPVPGVLAGLGVAVPSCNLVALSAEQLAPQAVDLPGLPALLSPVTVTAAQANSVASFAATPGQTPTTVTNNPTTTTPTSPGLARTGGDATLTLIGGALLAAFVLAARRTLAVARPQSSATLRVDNARYASRLHETAAGTGWDRGDGHAGRDPAGERVARRGVGGVAEAEPRGA